MPKKTKRTRRQIRLNRKQQAIVMANIPLVHDVAGMYSKRGLEYDDLVSEGMIGLMLAAKKYDPTRGTKFSTCAVPWIRREMRMAIKMQKQAVQIPDNLFMPMTRFQRKEEEMRRENGCKPTQLEVLKSMNLRGSKRAVMNNAVKALTVLNVGHLGTAGSRYDAGDTSNHTFGPSIDDAVKPRDLPNNVNDFVRKDHVMTHLAEMLRRLTPKQQKVICLKFGVKHATANPEGDGPMIQADIAPRMSITKAMVSLLERAALSEMGKMSKLPQFASLEPA